MVLAKYPRLDKHRVGVHGSSYGGTLSTALVEVSLSFQFPKFKYLLSSEYFDSEPFFSISWMLFKKRYHNKFEMLLI